MPDDPASERKPTSDKSLALVQREVALVVVLCVVAVVMFLATRRLADWHHGQATSAATAWYEKGQALLEAGETDEGIAALRKAVGADRANLRFTLALVRALRGANQDEEAWQILLRLREQEPEDAEINARLARLAVRRGDPDLGVRYYNHALYGIASEDAPVDRRAILQELAALLLDRQDVDSAAGVLSQLARELPDEPEARLDLARLYQRAGNPAEALAQYAAVLAGQPANPDALLGAADAAQGAGNLATALRHLDAAAAAGIDAPDLAGRREVVRLAVANDPLAVGLTMTERVRRLTAGLAWAAGRFGGCLPAADQTASATLGEDLEAFRRQPRQDLRDTDVLAAGVELVARLNADVRVRCGDRDPTGHAWQLIQRARGTAQ